MSAVRRILLFLAVYGLVLGSWAESMPNSNSTASVSFPKTTPPACRPPPLFSPAARAPPPLPAARTCPPLCGTTTDPTPIPPYLHLYKRSRTAYFRFPPLPCPRCHLPLRYRAAPPQTLAAAVPSPSPRHRELRCRRHLREPSPSPCLMPVWFTIKVPHLI